MKKLLCLLTILCMGLALASCRRQETPANSAAFYYPRVEPVYGAADGLIAPEIRETAAEARDPAALLAKYLEGPLDKALAQPFPAGLQLLSLQTENGAATVTLSDAIAALSDMELTIACSCLTLTVRDLTGFNTVRITTETALLGGSRVITMNADRILLLDSVTEPVESE